MKQLPLTTRAIQGARALNYAPDERWIDWAVRLLTYVKQRSLRRKRLIRAPHVRSWNY